MDPDTVVIWTSIYFSTSVIWLVISGLLLYGRPHCLFTTDCDCSPINYICYTNLIQRIQEESANTHLGWHLKYSFRSTL
jgi:hypothetical protein